VARTVRIPAWLDQQVTEACARLGEIDFTAFARIALAREVREHLMAKPSAQVAEPTPAPYGRPDNIEVTEDPQFARLNPGKKKYTVRAKPQ